MLELKCLKNLYDIINNYYDKLKEDYKKEIKQNEYNELKILHETKKQELFNYNISIYKNIEIKKIPFTELFNINNDTPYMLTSLETELLRHSIGLYDEGKKQSINEVSKRFKMSKEKITDALQTVMRCFGTELFQNSFLKERNEMIKNNIKILKNKVLDYDITFLNITDNFIEILRTENINKIRDILNINERQIKNMNIEYGYNPKIVVFPKRIIDEIESLGLKFKNDKMIDELFPKKENEEDEEKNETEYKESLGENLKTSDYLICARQFEPELLGRLSLTEQVYLDKEFGNGYLAEAYDNTKIEEIEYINETTSVKSLDLNYKNGKTFYMNKN